MLKKCFPTPPPGVESSSEDAQICKVQEFKDLYVAYVLRLSVDLFSMDNAGVIIYLGLISYRVSFETCRCCLRSLSDEPLAGLVDMTEQYRN